MKNPYHVEVGARIKLAAQECGFKNARTLAEAIGLDHGRVRQWLNGGSMPSIQEGINLKKKLSVTLDWIYHNDRSGISLQKWVRLQAVKQGLDPASAWVDDEEEVEITAPLELVPAPKSRRHQKV